MAMDHLMKALGAETVDWDRKVACCGASLTLTKTELVLEMSGDIIDNAHKRGADMLVVACPMCHANIDGRQMQMHQAPEMPALYFTQLMALAFDRDEEAGLSYNIVDPRPQLSSLGLL
jgi:heterodisulfide reductase subunit B